MKIKKAYEITNAEISFVSLVDKAANMKKFLITKANDGKAEFTAYGQIVKADNHFVTGIVYEPMTEDAHGNFMNEAEITKAAYNFAKKSNKIDLQHSFKPLENASVVESWIAKADFKLGESDIKKGTWLMTMEIADPKIWNAIQKGEITGFSMGGVGCYSKENISISSVEKVEISKQNEKKGILKKLAEFLGFDVTEKSTFVINSTEKEEKEMTKTEVEKIVKETVAETVAKAVKDNAQPEESENTKEEITKEMIQEMVIKTVAETVAPLLKARGIPTSLNDSVSEEKPIEKHYLHGIL